MTAHTALIIDDDAPTRYVYLRVLASLGFDVVEAGDGVEALRLAHLFAPRVILLDWLLPMMSGAEVLHAIYDDSALKHCCVIVISSQNQVDLELPLRPQDYFLRKPALPQQLRDTLRAANLA